MKQDDSSEEKTKHTWKGNLKTGREMARNGEKEENTKLQQTGLTLNPSSDSSTGQ